MLRSAPWTLGPGRRGTTLIYGSPAVCQAVLRGKDGCQGTFSLEPLVWGWQVGRGNDNGRGSVLRGGKASEWGWGPTGRGGSLL